MTGFHLNRLVLRYYILTIKTKKPKITCGISDISNMSENIQADIEDELRQHTDKP